MKTLYRDPTIDLSATPAEAGLGLEEELLRFIEELASVEISPGEIFETDYLTDDDGKHYPSVSFVVLSTYEVDGDSWISGNEFRLNLTALQADARQDLELWREQSA